MTQGELMHKNIMRQSLFFFETER